MMVLWRTLIAAELGIGVLAGAVFVFVYWSSPWGRSPAGRHMMAVAAVMCAEMASLLAIVVGVRLPLWLFVVAYAVVDAVVIHRLVLLYRARQAAKAETGPGYQRDPA